MHPLMQLLPLLILRHRSFLCWGWEAAQPQGSPVPPIPAPGPSALVINVPSGHPDQTRRIQVRPPGKISLPFGEPRTW